MQADQGQHAVAEDEAVALAGLVRELQARLDVGNRIVPFASGKALEALTSWYLGRCQRMPSSSPIRLPVLSVDLASSSRSSSVRMNRAAA